MPTALLLALACSSQPPPPDEATPVLALGEPAQWACAGCSIYDAATSGHLAYLADRKRGLVVLDLADCAAPQEVGLLPGGSPIAVAVEGATAWLGDWNRGLVAADVSEPASPRELSVTGTRYTAYYVEASGPWVYSGGEVFDAADPTAPREVAHLPVGPRGNGSQLAGERLVLAASSEGLVVVDLTAPRAPARVGHLETDHAKDVALYGHHAYVADWSRRSVLVVDLSDPARPVRVGELEVPAPPGGVDVLGGWLFAAAGSAGLLAWDLADPAAPKPVAATSAGPHDAYKVDARPGCVVVADRDRGVLLVPTVYQR